jgi:hypothetical protein
VVGCPSPPSTLPHNPPLKSRRSSKFKRPAPTAGADTEYVSHAFPVQPSPVQSISDPSPSPSERQDPPQKKFLFNTPIALASSFAAFAATARPVPVPLPAPGPIPFTPLPLPFWPPGELPALLSVAPAPAPPTPALRGFALRGFALPGCALPGSELTDDEGMPPVGGGWSNRADNVGRVLAVSDTALLGGDTDGARSVGLVVVAAMVVGGGNAAAVVPFCWCWWCGYCGCC